MTNAAETAARQTMLPLDHPILQDIRALAAARDHRLGRGMTGEASITLVSALSIKKHLEGRPVRPVSERIAEHLVTIADQPDPGTPVVPVPARNRTTPMAGKVTEVGYYLHDGSFYKVVRAVHGSGHLYAKRLSPEQGEWIVIRGAISQLRASEKATIEQITEYCSQLEFTPQMKLYGRCTLCARVLTDEDSIRNKVGPGPHRYV
jgi:hypothetical protein